MIKLIAPMLMAMINETNISEHNRYKYIYIDIVLISHSINGSVNFMKAFLMFSYPAN
jgi:hypothetical protein